MTSLLGARVEIPTDLREVMSWDAGAEEDPRAGGLQDADVEAIWQAACALYSTGMHPAISLCVRRRGRVVIDRAIGHARGRAPGAPGWAQGVPATPRTPFCVFSVSKAITAILIHQLDAEGLLRLDDRVADYIPGFGQRGKERMTVRHVLTHRAGIPSLAGHADPALLGDWDRILALLSEAAPATAPGRRLAYHAVTGGYLLGEIARRVSGKDLRTLLAERLRGPLGLDWFGYGVAPGRELEVAENAFTGLSPPPGVAQLARRALGVRFEDAAAISNDPRWLRAVVPSGNVVATARELSAFFQLLLDEGSFQGRQLLDRKAVRRATTESSWGELDLTLGLPVRYGLGFMLGTPWASPFGPRTPHAFGHYGFICVVGWADPQRGLAAALLTSGKPFAGPHLYRLWSFLKTVGERCR